MDKLIKILDDNKLIFTDYKEYEVLIDKIERNIVDRPDVSIECCKSLFEGISKKILIEIDNTFTGKERLEIGPLTKKLLEKLITSNSDKYTGDFITRSVSLTHIIGELRNSRGEVSHGQIYPKEFYSDYEIAKLSSGITESLLVFILERFFNFEVIKEPEYEDNEEFNNYLDEGNEEIFGKLYSYALFTLDYDKYESELDLFIANKEENE